MLNHPDSRNQNEPPARPANQTSTQYAQLESVILDNARLVAELETRLAPILRSCPPEATAPQGTPPQEYLVPLADSLRNLYLTASRNEAGLRSILDRVEI